jgi:hypothetical protein
MHIGRLDIQPAHVFTGFHLQSVVVYHAERAQAVQAGKRIIVAEGWPRIKPPVFRFRVFKGTPANFLVFSD